MKLRTYKVLVQRGTYNPRAGYYKMDIITYDLRSAYRQAETLLENPSDIVYSCESKDL